MFRRLLLGIVVLTSAANATGQGVAQESANKSVEVRKVKDVLTIWSVGRAPYKNASHTYILTHGLGGIDDRFYSMGQTILARQADSNVLVIDWSPGSDQRLFKIPNFVAASDRIDLTGDLLGVFLAKMSAQKCFDPMKATFIGESFGNCVNHRAAICLRKNGLKKAERALVLNPAPCTSGYQTPLFTVPFKQSLACVSDSCLDTRQAIANKMVLLKPNSPRQVEQHTHGMRWLQERIEAGNHIDSLFTPAKTNLAASPGMPN